MTLALHGFPDWQSKLATADLVSLDTSGVLALNGSLASAIFDMRAYQSFSLRTIQRVFGLRTVLGNVLIEMVWYADAAGTQPIFRDNFRVHPNGTGGGPATVTPDDVEYQDTTHGPYLQVIITNRGADQVTVTEQIFGHTRPLGRPYVRQVQFNAVSGDYDMSGPLLSESTFVPVGGFIDYPMRLCPTPVNIYLVTGAGVALSYQLFTPAGAIIWERALAAGAINHEEWRLPQESCLFRVNHPGGPANNFRVAITSDLYR